MRKFRLNKLVRDGILPFMLDRGQVVVYRVVEDDDEYRRLLLAKLGEEATEFAGAETPENCKKELADIFDVLEALATLEGVAVEFPAELSERKTNMGGFAGRIFVETVAVPDGDEWGDYYAKEPNRFPEIKEV